MLLPELSMLLLSTCSAFQGFNDDVRGSFPMLKTIIFMVSSMFAHDVACKSHVACKAQASPVCLLKSDPYDAVLQRGGLALHDATG